jgi:hypothetical protein
LSGFRLWMSSRHCGRSRVLSSVGALITDPESKEEPNAFQNAPKVWTYHRHLWFVKHISSFAGARLLIPVDVDRMKKHHGVWKLFIPIRKATIMGTGSSRRRHLRSNIAGSKIGHGSTHVSFRTNLWVKPISFRGYRSDTFSKRLRDALLFFFLLCQEATDWAENDCTMQWAREGPLIPNIASVSRQALNVFATDLWKWGSHVSLRWLSPDSWIQCLIHMMMYKFRSSV